MRTAILALMLLLMGGGTSFVAAQDKSLPQTPIAAAAVIVSYIAFERSPEIHLAFGYEIIDGDHVTFRTVMNREIPLARLDDCRFELRNPSTGFVTQIDFAKLSNEYTVRTDPGWPTTLRFAGQPGVLCEGTDAGGIRGKCYSDVVMHVREETEHRRVIRALEFISESCPLARLPF